MPGTHTESTPSTIADPSPTSAIFSDDDEYDLISNPGHLDSSLEGLLPNRTAGKDIFEPAPSEAAKDKLETASWSPEQIQTYVRRTLNVGPEVHANRTVRVYVDGAFDGFHIGQALQLRQAKLAFPFVHLTVGVFSSQQLIDHGFPPAHTDLERAELVRHCRWVNEVLTTDVPWEVSEAFLLQRRIDYVAIDEGTSVDPNCDKTRVRGYDEVKRIGKIILTRRTKGYSTTKRLSTGYSTGPPTPVLPQGGSPRIAASSRNQSYKQLPEVALPQSCKSLPEVALPPPVPVQPGPREKASTSVESEASGNGEQQEEDELDTPEPKLDMFGLDH